jgi:hypothetical protein
VKLRASATHSHTARTVLVSPTLTRYSIRLPTSAAYQTIMSLSVEVSHPAYSTLVLHCAKYPASEVMGFLLGSISSANKVIVEKSVPVQHHWNRLSPMVEVAASLVSREGMIEVTKCVAE